MPNPPRSTKVKTTAARVTAARDVKPEWLRPADVTRVFGIGRSHLFDLIKNGRVKSVCLRHRGAARGSRLISYDSLCELIAGAAAGKTI